VVTSVPQKILAAFTDFTDNRPKLWPGLSKEFYKVIQSGKRLLMLLKIGCAGQSMGKETYDGPIRALLDGP